MGSSHQNTKQILLKLEKKGFVAIVPDSLDKRKQRISLTEKCLQFCTDNDERSAFVIDKMFEGIPEEQLRKAAELAVCKINIDSDIRLAMTGNIRKYFAEHPDHFDPRQYLKPARQAVKDMVAHKIKNVLGSDGKA